MRSKSQGRGVQWPGVCFLCARPQIQCPEMPKFKKEKKSILVHQLKKNNNKNTTKIK